MLEQDPSKPVIPRPPRKPPDEECCHRGCDPCIFDYYWRALDRWEEQVSKLGLDPKAVMAEGGEG
jgi:hypothetical protein